MATAFAEWRSPPGLGRVVPGDGVDVWWLDLASPALNAQMLAACLTVAEAKDIARFRRSEDRLQRTAARVFLRWVLARHGLGCAPSAVHWERDEWGRPQLRADDDAQPAFDFNLSHAGTHVLIAISALGRVGVDVEVASEIETATLARVCAADVERVWLESPKTEAERRERFFRLWTCKEAVLKGQGWGLGCDPRRCTLDVEKGRADLDLPDQPRQSYAVAAVPIMNAVHAAVAWPGDDSRTVLGWRAPVGWLADVAAS